MNERMWVPNYWRKVLHNARWVQAYAWQLLATRLPQGNTLHLIIAVADHFEPSIMPNVAGNPYASRPEQERRVERWCSEYPRAVGAWRDTDGYPLRHTYFYPAEQYDKNLIERLAQHCRAGWGEIEIHLHHGVDVPATSESTRQQLVEFRNALVEHGCLSRDKAGGQTRYAFVHGNWALANSARGRCCGVNDEMKILADTGCYADFTLPSAPHLSQVSKINSLYECALPLDKAAPHRRGFNLKVGRMPSIFPLVIQGPLLLDFESTLRRNPFPAIENGELTARNPPSLRRLRIWARAGIAVEGRADWVFIKLHCHGMDPSHEDAMLGKPLVRFLRDLAIEAGHSPGYLFHFVTAREMVNIALAACAGCEGNPGEYRNYRFVPVRPPTLPISFEEKERGHVQ